ncbi:hypothetical protein PGT21_032733 [Puccinia graminis f. sp. tritici]|uniref:Uncharacterized protein n=1 Tax=Puccinia graminis f. sp. tritici TaxID=56615 RepID=A0A5B0NFJ3_PUCGR|nr:hypothetical protein PGT21_032733 [Puccinia graminis f. sp. tritici]
MSVDSEYPPIYYSVVIQGHRRHSQYRHTVLRLRRTKDTDGKPIGLSRLPPPTIFSCHRVNLPSIHLQYPIYQPTPVYFLPLFPWSIFQLTIMPTYYVNPFGLETPTTTNAYPSLPSTILPDSPELDLPHIDTRSNTPDGQTQLRVDDIPGYKGKLVKVLVAFKLYVVSKNKKKEKTWVPCGSTSEFPVDVTLGVTDFDQFRELVAAACNLHFKSTGGIIRESIEDPVRMPLAWLVSIPRVDEWKKSDKVKMKDASDYQDWLVTAFRAGKKSVGLDIRMTDPAEAKRRAKKEDLLAKREARAAAVKASASKKRKAKNGRGGSGGGGDGGGGGDSGGGGGGGGGPDGAYSEVSSDTDNSGSEIDADDFDDINFHMRSIYRAHPTNVTYDRLIPVYIDPTNPRRYILLLTAAVQTWAKDLVCPFAIVHRWSETEDFWVFVRS